jgi:hypothetical protein
MSGSKPADLTKSTSQMAILFSKNHQRIGTKNATRYFGVLCSKSTQKMGLLAGSTMEVQS